jgi:phage terminase small subunit
VTKNTQKPLTARQQKFVDLYDGNATETARKAGYTGNANSLSATAQNLLRNTKVAGAIRNRQSKEIKPLIADRKERQKFWTDTMKNDEENIHARLKASELLGKSECDFVEKREDSGPNGGPIKHEWKITVERVDAKNNPNPSG